MIRFAKSAICPSSELLEAYRDDALATVLVRAVAAHLSECDFCAAEFRLLAVTVHKTQARAEVERERESASEETPPVPFALSMFAESRLAEAALRSSLSRLRAA